MVCVQVFFSKNTIALRGRPNFVITLLLCCIFDHLCVLCGIGCKVQGLGSKVQGLGVEQHPGSPVYARFVVSELAFRERET